jgi:hypothetical protein
MVFKHSRDINKYPPPWLGTHRNTPHTASDVRNLADFRIQIKYSATFADCLVRLGNANFFEAEELLLFFLKLSI